MKEDFIIVTKHHIKVKIPIEHLEPRPIELTNKERQRLRVFTSKIKKAPDYVWVYAG